jgi:hypothetical protein
VTARILRTEQDRAAWVQFLAAQPLPITVSSIKGARRSNQQSKTAEAWYSQIGAETGQAPIEAKAECKLTFGLPIMQRDRPDWVAKWAPLYDPLPYAMRLRLFEAIPLTSLFTTRQMGEYMDAVQRRYRQMGVPLWYPEALRYEQEMGARR